MANDDVIFVGSSIVKLLKPSGTFAYDSIVKKWFI